MAVLTRVPGAAVASTVKMAVMVRVWPDASAPRSQGNGVVQAPEFETNVRPAGAESATITACASPGPAFATFSTYEIASPGRAVASPVLIIGEISGRCGHNSRRGRTVVAGIEIARRRGDGRRVEDGGWSRITRRHCEGRLDRASLAGRNRAERTRERRRAIAGVSDERQTGWCGIRHRDRQRRRSARCCSRRIVYVTFAPGVTFAGPVFETARSAEEAPTGVVTVAWLSVTFSSATVVVTVAVLEMGLGADIAGGNGEGRRDLAALARG